MPAQPKYGATAHTESRGFSLNGWFMLVVVVVLFSSVCWLLQSLFEPSDFRSLSIAPAALVLAITLSKGLFILQPNESALLLFSALIRAQCGRPGSAGPTRFVAG